MGAEIEPRSNRFQTVCGPSQSKVHIYDKDPTAVDHKLTICQRTTPARIVRGRIDSRAICSTCLRGVATRIGNGDVITAELIGCAEIC